MAARLQTLLIVGAASLAGVGAIYFVPGVAASSDAVHVSGNAPAQAAETTSVVAQAAPARASCTSQAWPYLTSPCDGENGAGTPASRQVRIISTDRDAPRAVPLPAERTAAAQAEVQQPPSVTNLASAVSVLPPARPQDPAKGPDGSPVVASRDVETTGSVQPVKVATAKPARRPVARVRQVREMLTADRDLEPVVQTTTYHYPDGREVVVRSDRMQERRQMFADDSMDRRSLPQRSGPRTLLGFLSGSDF